MIPRYKRKEISKIWELENKFNIWLKIELLICEALSNRGDIPKDSFKTIKKNARFDIDRIDVIEKDVKHDVIAFLTNIGENIGHDSRFVHMGVTSSDIIDTAFSIQLKQSCSVLKRELKRLLNNLKVKSLNFKNTACIGRSHGIFAEPTTFGLKMLGKYCEFERHYKRLCDAEKQISICSISGAVGTYANIDPSIESFVAKKLRLKTEDVSTQIIPRDRHAFFFTALAMIASSIENLAIEFRHLHRSEVREVEEFFSKDQKGSSAMPHKKNPVLSENLTGLARLVRSTVIPAMENVALWHERDISHSSVERNIGPDSTVTLDFALNRMNEIVKSMKVDSRNMKKNLDLTKGLFFSQRVLLHLTVQGFKREVAYRMVQKCALKSIENNKSFYNSLLEDKKIRDIISVNNLKKLFDFSYHTKKINVIFNRVLKKNE